MSPLVDLAAQHREITGEVDEGFARVAARSAFILGDEVGDFERAFADFVGIKHCVGVANGTDALEIVLRAAGIDMGDEVVVPANTFFASALAVVRAGATPVFAEWHRRANLTARTKARIHDLGCCFHLPSIEVPRCT